MLTGRSTMQDEQPPQSPKKSANGPSSLRIAKICAGINFSLFVFIILIVISTAEQTTQTTPETSIAPAASTIDKQVEQLLVAENIKAANNDQLLATAAAAAMRIQKQMAVQYSSMVLFDSQNRDTTYLTLDFAPDKKGANGDTDSGNRFKVTWYNKLSAQ